MKVLETLVVSSCVATAVAQRYNLGSGAYIDDSNNTWEADPISSGNAVNECPLPIYGIANLDLYCSYREWSAEQTTGVMDFAVSENGYYKTVLYFFENGGSEGDRIVDVYLEDQLIYDNLDVHCLYRGFTIWVLLRYVF